MRFPQLFILNRHFRTHTSSNDHQCNTCQQRFCQSKSFKHIHSIHEEKQPSTIIPGHPNAMMSRCNGCLTWETENSAKQLTCSYKKAETIESLDVEDSSLRSIEEKPQTKQSIQSDQSYQNKFRSRNIFFFKNYYRNRESAKENH